VSLDELGDQHGDQIVVVELVELIDVLHYRSRQITVRRFDDVEWNAALKRGPFGERLSRAS
jgi:hypothetical protein